MKTQTQRSQGPCLQGHMAQSVSLLSYSSASTSAKGLLFLHLKLIRGWYSFSGPRRGLGKTVVLMLRSPRMENVWTAGGSSVLGVVVTPESSESKVYAHRGRHRSKAWLLLSDLSPSLHPPPPEPSGPSDTFRRVFPLLCHVIPEEPVGTIGENDLKSFTTERLHLDN